MRYVLVLFSAMMFATFSFAPARADDAGAKAFIEDLANKVIQVLQDKTAAPADKGAKLKQVFEGHVAIDWVGRFVLGRHWNEANDQQKEAYIANYKAFVINSYSQRLQEYTGETYQILSTKPSGEGRYLLEMKINRANGQQPVMVNYRVREENGGYQVYDLLVEGVSLIQTQRSEFDSVVSRQGLDYLIAQLKQRADNPSKPPV